MRKFTAGRELEDALKAPTKDHKVAWLLSIVGYILISVFLLLYILSIPSSRAPRFPYETVRNTSYIVLLLAAISITVGILKLKKTKDRRDSIVYLARRSYLIIKDKTVCGMPFSKTNLFGCKIIEINYTDIVSVKRRFMNPEVDDFVTFQVVAKNAKYDFVIDGSEEAEFEINKLIKQ